MPAADAYAPAACASSSSSSPAVCPASSSSSSSSSVMSNSSNSDERVPFLRRRLLGMQSGVVHLGERAKAVNPYVKYGLDTLSVWSAPALDVIKSHGEPLLARADAGLEKSVGVVDATLMQPARRMHAAASAVAAAAREHEELSPAGVLEAGASLVSAHVAGAKSAVKSAVTDKWNEVYTGALAKLDRLVPATITSDKDQDSADEDMAETNEADSTPATPAATPKDERKDDSAPASATATSPVSTTESTSTPTSTAAPSAPSLQALRARVVARARSGVKTGLRRVRAFSSGQLHNVVHVDVVAVAESALEKANKVLSADAARVRTLAADSRSRIHARVAAVQQQLLELKAAIQAHPTVTAVQARVAAANEVFVAPVLAGVRTRTDAAVKRATELTATTRTYLSSRPLRRIPSDLLAFLQSAPATYLPASVLARAQTLLSSVIALRQQLSELLAAKVAAAKSRLSNKTVDTTATATASAPVTITTTVSSPIGTTPSSPEAKVDPVEEREPVATEEETKHIAELPLPVDTAAATAAAATAATTTTTTATTETKDAETAAPAATPAAAAAPVEPEAAVEAEVAPAAAAAAAAAAAPVVVEAEATAEVEAAPASPKANAKKASKAGKQSRRK